MSSAGEHTEYTEVPLSDLDIAAADSLTLSPHNGKFPLSVAHRKVSLKQGNVLLL